MSFRVISIIAALLSAFSIFAAPVPAPEEDVSKARLLLSPDRWIQMHYFLQAGNDFEFNEDYLSKNNYFVKRNRLIFNGQTADKFYFFFQTDDFSVNEDPSTGDNSLYVQDAYLNYAMFDFFQIYAGQMALPFSRMNVQSAATTLTNDINAGAYSLYNYSNDGRDTGVMFRGFVFQRYLEYRVGFFRGFGRKTVYEDPEDPTSQAHLRNSGDWPRFTGRLQVHIADREEGFYYSENYLGKRNIFAFGFGFDFQPTVCDTNNDGDPKNYMAFTLDVTVDRSLPGSNAFALEAAITFGQGNPGDYQQYSDLDYTQYLVAYAQAGMLFAGKWQPFGRYSFKNAFSAKGSSNYSFHTFSFGTNYFIDGHNANFRAQYDIPVGDNKDRDGEHKITLQMQCYL